MNWTVLWNHESERRLTTMWVTSTPADRKAITAAANRIDALLKIDPENAGESRLGDRRILIEAPLGVTFRVFPDDRLVRVAAVWHFKQGPRNKPGGNQHP